MKAETMTDFSDEQLSRWIAEKLEPLSTLPNEDDCDHADMEAFPTEYWLASYRMSRVTCMHVPSWEPRDMVNDPAMTVMLLEKMPEPSLWLESNPGDAVKIWGCSADMSTNLDNGWSDRIGRAVAESFALAHGWTEE